jgi:hypothetical protein
MSATLSSADQAYQQLLHSLRLPELARQLQAAVRAVFDPATHLTTLQSLLR